MPKEMDDLLTRLDELMMEAHEKGYSFVFDTDTVNEEGMNITMTMYSGNPTFVIDIIEWDYTNED